jgi:hypothetical protein
MFSSIDEATALAKSICGNATEEDETLFRQWCWEGMLMFGVSEDEIKVCSIIPKNGLAKKPEDCRRILDLALYDSQGCLIPSVFRPGKRRLYPISSPTNVIVSDDTIIPLWVDTSEDMYNITLGSNSDCVSVVGIRYFAYPLDAQGLPLIRQNEALPLSYFCKFMWSMRKNENQSEIANNEQRWLRACDTIRASKKMISQEQMKTIARAWRSLIPNLNDNQF